MKKMIAIALAFALLLCNVLPQNALAKSSDPHYMEVVDADSPLRTRASQKGDVICELQEGDCLTVTGEKKNIHGNLWYIVDYGGEQGYIYAPHLKEHVHDYCPVTDDLSVCKCGSFDYTCDDGIAPIAADVLNPSFLPPDVVGGLVTLGGTLGTIAEAAASAFPYVVIALAGGAVVYMAVSKAGTQVDTTSIEMVEMNNLTNAENFGGNLDSEKPYHPAIFINKYRTLIITKDGMDLDTAAGFVWAIPTGLNYVPFTSYKYLGKLNTWCAEQSDAYDLCKKVCSAPGFEFGTSSGSDHQSEIDQNLKSERVYFYHYHIFIRNSPAMELHKLKGTHILYGYPVVSSFA